MKAERRLDLDMMRAWLCTAVMLGHVFGLLVPLYGTRRLVLSTSLAIASSCIRINVPGFLFLAGYLAVYGKEHFSSMRFLRSRLRNTLPLYLTFATLYYLYNYLVMEGFAGLPQRVFDGTASYHLYFVPITLQLYLLTPILVRAVKRWPRIALAFSIVLSYAYTVVQIIVAPRLDGSFWCVPYLVYYCWGIYAATEINSLPGRLASIPQSRKAIGGITALFLGCASLYGGALHLAGYAAIVPIPNPWYSFLLCALEYLKCSLGIVAVLQMAMLLARQTRGSAVWLRSIAFASKNSYFVYLAHPFVLMWLHQIPWLTAHPHWLLFIFVPLMWLATWCWLTPIHSFRSTFYKFSA